MGRIGFGAALLGGLAAAAAAPARAQVTAEEVWAATEAYWEAFGVEVSAATARDGAALAVTGIRAEGAFPFGLGTLAVEAQDLRLTERGDGTVLVEPANPGLVTLSLAWEDWSGPVALRLPVRVAWDGREAVASGAPGDVTFALRSGPVQVSLEEARMEGPADGAPFAMAFDARLDSVEATTRVTHGARVEVASDMAFGPAIWGGSATDPVSGTESRELGRTEASTATLALSLPAGGPRLDALAAELRAGLSVDLASAADGGLSQSVILRDGAVADSTATESGPGTARLRLDAGGLAMETRFAGTAFSTVQSMLGLEVGGRIGEYGLAVALPLLAGEAPQPFALSLALRDVAPDPATWDLLDATGTLPRDPATLAFALEGTARLPFDLTDGAAWTRLAMGGQAPPAVEALRLGGVEARLFGAALAGEGEFAAAAGGAALPEGWPAGLPWPAGRAAFDLEGAQALLDALVALGWLAGEDARSARLALALALEATGPDRARTEVEVAPDGGVVVNGQRLR